MRDRVKCGRVSGKVLRWADDTAWIRPDVPIEHPLREKNRGEVLVKKGDVAAGQDLKPGVAVDFLVYSEKDDAGSSRLCGDFCRAIPSKPGAGKAVGKAVGKATGKAAGKGGGKAAGKAAGKAGNAVIQKVYQKSRDSGPTPRGSVGLAITASKLSVKGKGKQLQAAQPAQKSKIPGSVPLKTPGKASAKAMPGKAAPVKPAIRPATAAPVLKSHLKVQPKGKGKGKGEGKAESREEVRKKERVLISKLPQLGTVTKWLGGYGWIEPDNVVEHPAASKHNGKIFLHTSDMKEGTEAPYLGARVTFSVYVWSSGLSCSESAGSG